MFSAPDSSSLIKLSVVGEEEEEGSVVVEDLVFKGETHSDNLLHGLNKLRLDQSNALRYISNVPGFQLVKGWK